MFAETDLIEKNKDIGEYNILYVDDEAVNLRIFKMAFKKAYNVFTAENGHEAMEVLKNEDIHLIITDQKMPGMTGTELLHNTIGEYPDIIRIILTGFADIDAIVQAVNKCGIYKYITKPYDQGDMRLTLDKALELFKVKEEKKGLIDELATINRELEIKVKVRTQELEESNKRLTDGLIYAQTVQEFMLPKDDDLSDAFEDLFVIYRPKDFVGGDFYWFKQFEGSTGSASILAVVDCMGHGVAGALLSMIGETELSVITKGRRLPRVNNILNKLDEKIRGSFVNSGVEGHNATMDASLVVVDREKGKMEFSGAKSDLIYIKDGQLNRIRGTRKSIGSSWNEEAVFERHTISLEGVTEMYLFSDGLQDQYNSDNTKKFGSKKLLELIESTHGDSIPDQRKKFLCVLEDWQRDTEQVDDITLIGVRL